ncbi:MAG: hypothetical protein UX94_C0011G0016 [Parcubacteria group bacterium GW2011_GWA2_47_21]|nr:MAG: hypothetical protein UX94_C0011G0016 [Parcubacteria group bacterium GW2011_GWA2_47_21]
MSHLLCKICRKKFYVRPTHVKIGWGKYCSRSCHHKGMRTGKFIGCFLCGKGIYRTPTSMLHSKSKKYFCSKSCQTKWRNTQYIGSKHANWKDGKNAYKSVLNRHGIMPICFYCRTRDKRILAVHHIDENHFHNYVSNLAWLCHNCHYLVHNDKVEKQKFLANLNKN